MLTWFLAFAISWHDEISLVRTAPLYLHPEKASVHLAAARVAQEATGIDADLLLSIAWHESRYTPSLVYAEPEGGVSCGAMTPEPVARCERTLLEVEYTTGALHLKRWLNACQGGMWCALTGYAGGYRLIAFCSQKENARRKGCAIPWIFQSRATWIKRERARAVSS